MELYIYNDEMELQGLVEKITSLIWTRRYWSCGEFKLLVPFTEDHAAWLVKNNIVMKNGDTEAAQIRYVHITKNSEGMEEIEVQGKFLLYWTGKRIVKNQIITNATTQAILYRIVRENITEATDAERQIPDFSISATDDDAGSPAIDYTSEKYSNALLAIETAAKAAALGVRVVTSQRTGLHVFSVYAGRNLTADQQINQPCVFSQEFDNIIEQDFENSTENLKSTAYVGGEEKENTPRKIALVGGAVEGLERDEVFINATDIVQTYEENDVEIVLTDQQYLALLSARGTEELEQYAETLAFGSKVNTHSNLKYREDYDLGDRVTCINKRWGIKINVRITEIAETYQQNIEEIDITFGESIPALLSQIQRMIQ